MRAVAIGCALGAVMCALALLALTGEGDGGRQRGVVDGITEDGAGIARGEPLLGGDQSPADTDSGDRGAAGGDGEEATGADGPDGEECGAAGECDGIEADLDVPPPGSVDAPDAPVPAATRVSALSARGIEAIICSYPWPCAEALAVARCESGLNPIAVSPDGANWGLMQLNQPTWAPYFGAQRWASVLDATANVAMAYEIYQRAGSWASWSCRP